MVGNDSFFAMPGLEPAIEDLQRQLDGLALNSHNHILICGQQGVGKTCFFIPIVKERLWLYTEIIEIDCATLSKDQLKGWLQYDYNPQKAIYLDNIDKLKHKNYKYLNGLMDKARVIATAGIEESQLQQELRNKFKIIVDVPPLYKHRADILYFIARKWPDRWVSNVDLMRLCAYHWPGNYRELDNATQKLFSTSKLPLDITGEEKFRRIFVSLFESGLTFSDLVTVNKTCFAHIVPHADNSGFFFPASLKFRHIHNDSDSGIEMVCDPLFSGSNIILEDLEIQLVLKEFFQLVFGESVMLLNRDLFDLEPFTEESLKVIEWAQQQVDARASFSFASYLNKYFKSFSLQSIFGESSMVRSSNIFDHEPLMEESLEVIEWAQRRDNGWKIGDSRQELFDLRFSLDPYFDNSCYSFSHFSEHLTQVQIDAVKNFLKVCKIACERKEKDVSIAGDESALPKQIAPEGYPDAYIIGDVLLCAAFSYGEKSINAVTNTMRKYDKNLNYEYEPKPKGRKMLQRSIVNQILTWKKEKKQK
jgi:hypothetical protein